MNSFSFVLPFSIRLERLAYLLLKCIPTLYTCWAQFRRRLK